MANLVSAICLTLAMAPHAAAATSPVSGQDSKSATRFEIAAAGKKCPFLTRWSTQWRKCVWITQSGSSTRGITPDGGVHPIAQ